MTTVTVLVARGAAVGRHGTVHRHRAPTVAVVVAAVAVVAALAAMAVLVDPLTGPCAVRALPTPRLLCRARRVAPRLGGSGGLGAHAVAEAAAAPFEAPLACGLGVCGGAGGGVGLATAQLL